MVDGDDPDEVKLECKRSTPCENSRTVHISHHNSGTVIDSEKVQLTTMGFPASHQPRSCRASPLISPKFLVFGEISTRNHKMSATKIHCLNTSSGKVVTQSTTYRPVSTFWQGTTPFP